MAPYLPANVSPHLDVDAERPVPGQPAYFLGRASSEPPKSAFGEVFDLFSHSSHVTAEQVPPSRRAGGATVDEDDQVSLLAQKGPLRLSVVENLLAVHRLSEEPRKERGRGFTWLFDVKYPSSQALSYGPMPCEAASSDVSIDEPILFSLPSAFLLSRTAYHLRVDVSYLLSFYEKNFAYLKQFHLQTLSQMLLADQRSSSAAASGYTTSYDLFLNRESNKGLTREQPAPSLPRHLTGGVGFGVSPQAVASYVHGLLESGKEFVNSTIIGGKEKERILSFGVNFEAHYASLLGAGGGDEDHSSSSGEDRLRSELDQERLWLSTYLLRVLLWRPNCRDRVVYLLQKALLSRLPVDELGHTCSVLNSAYRSVIEKLNAATTGELQKISLQTLINRLSGTTILTEKDMVGGFWWVAVLEDFLVE